MAKKAKVRKNVVRGIAPIRATQNNTIVTLTDMNGETVCWDSAGTMGFRARKSTPFAATRAGESAGSKARKMGMSEIEVRINGRRLGSRVRGQRPGLYRPPRDGSRGPHARTPQRMPPRQASPRLSRFRHLTRFVCGVYCSGCRRHRARPSRVQFAVTPGFQACRPRAAESLGR